MHLLTSHRHRFYAILFWLICICCTHIKVHFMIDEQFCLLKQMYTVEFLFACLCVLLKSQGKNTKKKSKKIIKNENSYKAKLHGNKHYWARSWSVNISELNTFVRKIRNRGCCLKCYWPIAIHTIHAQIQTHSQKYQQHTYTLTHVHTHIDAQ